MMRLPFVSSVPTQPSTCQGRGMMGGMEEGGLGGRVGVLRGIYV
jgi:hypothetical protein